MISNRIGLLVFAMLVVLACGQKDIKPKDNQLAASRLVLGDSTVFLIFGIHNEGSVLLLNVHENEQTALQVMYEKGKSDSLPFLFLHQAGQRRIFYSINDSVHSVDPNRIFSAVGIAKTLEDSMYSTRAGVSLAETLAHSVLGWVKDRKWVVTLHNNTEEYYSILSYAEGGEEEMNAQDIIIMEDQDPDDFILTTSKPLFDELKNAGVNIVLQSKNPLDDGSLSVYCEANHIPYVNIEAEHGHLSKQKQLLDLVLKSIENTDTRIAN